MVELIGTGRGNSDLGALAEKQMESEKEEDGETLAIENDTARTKTQICSRCLKEIDKEKMDARSIQEEMERSDDINGFMEIANKHWPEETYKKVIEKQCNPLAAPTDYEMAIIITETTDIERGLTRQIRDRYPETEGIITEKQIEEQMISIDTITKTKIGDKIVENERTTYIIKGGNEKDGEIDPKRVYDSVEKIRQKMGNKGKKKLAIAWDAANNRVMLKKMLEYIYKKSEIEITLCTPIKGNKKIVEPQKEANNKRKETQENKKENQVIWMKSETESYADLLKKLKKDVNIEQIGIEVVAVRKTRNGQLMLTIKGGDGGKMNSLKEEINTKVGKVDIKDNIGQRRILQIKNIDATMEDKEVEKIIRDTLKKEDKTTIRVKAMSASYGENQMATIEAEEEEANELIEMGEIKIGWVKCKIIEKTYIKMEKKRCYKCWEYGHIAEKCRGESKENRCYRCGEEGHKARECKNKARCAICKEEGHRMDTMECPKYRKIVEKDSRNRGRNDQVSTSQRK